MEPRARARPLRKPSRRRATQRPRQFAGDATRGQLQRPSRMQLTTLTALAAMTRTGSGRRLCARIARALMKYVVPFVRHRAPNRAISVSQRVSPGLSRATERGPIFPRATRAPPFWQPSGNHATAGFRSFGMACANLGPGKSSYFTLLIGLYTADRKTTNLGVVGSNPARCANFNNELPNQPVHQMLHAGQSRGRTSLRAPPRRVHLANLGTHLRSARSTRPRLAPPPTARRPMQSLK